MGSRGREKPVPAADFIYQLEVPGQVAVPEAACAISADSRPVPSGRSAHEVWHLAGRSHEAVIEARPPGGAADGAEQASRRHVSSAGPKGRKTLQDFFVDAKIDRFEREITP